MKRLLSTLIIAALFICAAKISYSADIDEYRSAFMTMLNKARENPAGYIADRKISVHKDVQAETLAGLNSLRLNPLLSEAAQDHALDMLHKQYYAYDSPQGITPEDRILKKGYVAVESSRSIGLLSAVNYIPPEDVLVNIFHGMAADELSGVFEAALFDPLAEEAGLGFVSGRFNSGGQLHNVYIVVCYFATSAESYVESVLLQKINLARENPVKAAVSAGCFDEDEVDGVQHSWLNPMPPLARKALLDQASTRHADDMIARMYLSQVSPDGITPEQRVDQAGYDALHVGQAVVLGFMAPDQKYSSLADDLFNQLLRQEIGSDSDNVPGHILASDFSQAGLDIKFYSPEGVEGALVLASIKTAVPVEVDHYIAGGVFAREADEESSSVFGLSGLRTVLLDEAGNFISTLRSDLAGGFQYPVQPGSEYILNLVDQDGSVLSSHTPGIAGSNVFAGFWTSLDNQQIIDNLRVY